MTTPAGVDILTDLGITKIRNAATSGTQVRIAEVALGDGLGAAYAPASTQTALRRELLRQPVDTSAKLGAAAWQVKVTFAAAVAPITVREMGFFDADGDLIALWAGSGVLDTRATGGLDYNLIHVLHFSGVEDGVVVVAAPLDDQLSWRATVAADLTQLALNQAQLTERVNALETA